MAAIIFLILVSTCPDEEDYYKWLNKEYGILCYDTAFQGRVCFKDDEPIRWSSRHITRAGIYMQFEEKYKREDHILYDVRTTGVFGFFFDRSP